MGSFTSRGVVNTEEFTTVYRPQPRTLESLPIWRRITKAALSTQLFEDPECWYGRGSDPHPPTRLSDIQPTEPIDLFSLYVLFSHFRPRDATRGNSFFQMSSYARANLRITNEKTKGKFPWGHHVVWNGKTKCTSWKGLLVGGSLSQRLSSPAFLCLWREKS